MPQQTPFTNINEWLIPFLLEKGKEKRAAKRRTEREQSLIRDFRIIQGGGTLGQLQPGAAGAPVPQDIIRGEKVDAAARLSAAGAGVPASLLAEPTDVSGLRTQYPGYDYIWDEVEKGNLTVNQAINQVDPSKGAGRTGELSLDVAKRIIQSGQLKGSPYEDYSALQLVDLSKTKAALGTEFISSLGPPKPNRPAEFKLKQNAIAAITAGRAFEDLTEQDHLQLDAVGVTDKELRTAYAIPGLSATEYVYIEGELYDTVTDWASPMSGPYIRWSTGQPAGDEDQKALDDKYFPFFEKNFDKKTGLPKSEYIQKKGISAKILNYPMNAKVKTTMDQIIKYMELNPDVTVEDIKNQYITSKSVGTATGLSRRDFNILINRLELFIDPENVGK